MFPFWDSSIWKQINYSSQCTSLILFSPKQISWVLKIYETFLKPHQIFQEVVLQSHYFTLKDPSVPNCSCSCAYNCTYTTYKSYRESGVVVGLFKEKRSVGQHGNFNVQLHKYPCWGRSSCSNKTWRVHLLKRQSLITIQMAHNVGKAFIWDDRTYERSCTWKGCMISCP